MTWKLTEWAETRTPLTGVPWRDLTDEEFAAAEALFPEGALREQGYFVKVVEPKADDEPAPRRAKK